MIISTPADYRPQVRLLKSLTERVLEERDRLIQEPSDWHDQTQVIRLFSTHQKQQQAERDLPR